MGMILGIIVLLFVISLLWAIYAMKKEEKVHGKVAHVKSELQKEKVLFKA